MKFLIADRQDERHAKIRSYLNDETAVIAVLLSAIDLEWTIRRTIDSALGNSLDEIGKKNVSGLEGYEKAWNKFCVKGFGFEPLDTLVGNWSELKKFYQIRHDIVHGRVGSTGVKYATRRVEAILQASKTIAEAGRTKKADPYRRLRKRRLVGQTKID